MSRPKAFFLLSSIWFIAIGPAITAVIPPLVPFAYMAGAFPALIAGLAFAFKHRAIEVAENRSSRAYVGSICGSTTSFIFFVATYLGMQRGIPHFEQPAAYRIEAESFITALLGFTLIGAMAGAFAAAMMPKRLRNMGAYGNDDAP